jgi:hypothetical protein
LENFIFSSLSVFFTTPKWPTEYVGDDALENFGNSKITSDLYMLTFHSTLMCEHEKLCAIFLNDRKYKKKNLQESTNKTHFPTHIFGSRSTFLAHSMILFVCFATIMILFLNIVFNFVLCDFLILFQPFENWKYGRFYSTLSLDVRANGDLDTF